MSFLRPEVFELRGEPLGLVFGDGRPEDTELLCISPCRPAPSVSSGRAQAPFVSSEGALPAAVRLRSVAVAGFDFLRHSVLMNIWQFPSSIGRPKAKSFSAPQCRYSRPSVQGQHETAGTLRCAQTRLRTGSRRIDLRVLAQQLPTAAAP